MSTPSAKSLRREDANTYRRLKNLNYHYNFILRGRNAGLDPVLAFVTGRTLPSRKTDSLGEYADHYLSVQSKSKDSTTDKQITS
jgi:hypothetical protein